LVNRARLLVLAAILVPVILLAGNLLLFDSTQVASSPNAHYTSFSLGGRTFKLTYVATNQTELQRGLMGRKVTNSTTMLFVFATQGYYSFWMYGVNASLDMMWVEVPPGSSTGHVVFLALDSPPCHVSVFCQSYAPSAEANYVIEAKAGFAQANGVQVGTPVTLN
jgi:uncharacterized membrane protein (UPF0127 family)